MLDEQPIITPSSIVRLPQIPPQQVAARRQKYTRPVLMRYTVLIEYIPGEARRKEPGTGEALLGCAVLLVVSVLLVALLYYLSSAG